MIESLISFQLMLWGESTCGRINQAYIAKQLTNSKDCVNSGGSVHYLNKTTAHLDSYSKIDYRVVFFFGEGTRLDS